MVGIHPTAVYFRFGSEFNHEQAKPHVGQAVWRDAHASTMDGADATTVCFRSRICSTTNRPFWGMSATHRAIGALRKKAASAAFL